MTEAKPPIRIFLSYAHEDQKLVEALYHQLASAGFEPWMDTRDILPGEMWMESIRSAIEHSDFFLACLSPNSVLKRGVLQREFKSALDIWQGMLDSDIYFIPVRLQNCSVPGSMTKFQWVDLFESDGFTRLENALRKGIARRTSETYPEVPTAGAIPGVENHARDEIGPRNGRVRFGRRRSVSFWGSIVGALAAVAMLPLVYNNYMYQVKRPDLPTTCQVSSEPVRVGLARLAGCSPTFQDQLASNWTGEIVETSIIPQSIDASGAARQQSKYDLVVWGACDPSSDDAARLTFELITSRRPDSVYEPSRLPVSGSLAEISDVGLALMNYQHGDYAHAANLFGSLPESLHSPSLSLFRSNSLLFAERYDQAIESYDEVARGGDINAAAAYNNIGVTYYDQDANQGLKQFSQAIEMANSLKAADVQALALLNRSEFHRVQSDWEKAEDDCRSLERLNGQSALPYFCKASYNFLYYRIEPPGVLPLSEINRNLTDSQKYADAPALLHYLWGNWHMSHSWKQKQDAVDSYVAYLKQMENRACLQNDRGYVTDAQERIQELTRP